MDLSGGQVLPPVQTLVATIIFAKGENAYLVLSPVPQQKRQSIKWIAVFLALSKHSIKRNIEYFSESSPQSVALRSSDLIDKKIEEILCVLGTWGALVKLDNKRAFTNRICDRQKDDILIGK